MNPMLVVSHVSKSYGEGPARVDALIDVDLVVAPGELVAIMGPSGSGKSTLLTIAGTLEEATSGEIEIGGRPVSRMSRAERAQLRRRSIGYVFQDFNLLSGLTAVENVALPLELEGMRNRAARTAAEVALEQLGLSSGIDRYPEELSGGERQRVAIARSIVGDRCLLLADEPTGALDSETSVQIMNLLEEIHGQGITVVVVTHEHDVAERAGRIIRLKDGKVVDAHHDQPHTSSPSLPAAPAAQAVGDAPVAG